MENSEQQWEFSNDANQPTRLLPKCPQDELLIVILHFILALE